MTKELINQEFKFDVTVNTEIKMNDQEKLETLVSAVEEKYKGLVFTDENTQEAKSTRAELNKLIKMLDDERKRIKKGFNEPLKDFEAVMTGYVNRIKNVTEPIDTGIKEFEENQKKERYDKVVTFIEESAINYGLAVDEIEISDSWLLKSTSEIARMKLITDEMTRLQNEKEHLVNEISIIEAYCKALNVDNGGWLSRVKNGESSATIMKEIDAFVKTENERIEFEKQLSIQKTQQEAEVVDQNKGAIQVIEEVPERINENEQDLETIETIFAPKQPEFETLVLKLTGTSSQFKALSDYIISSGLKAEKI